MKTNFRLCALGVSLTGLAFCVGCEENQASAHVPLVAPAAPAYTLAAAPDEEPPAPAPAKPAEVPAPAVKNETLPGPAAPVPAAPAAPAFPPGSIIITRAPATNVAPAAPVPPPSLGPTPAQAEPPRLSPALSEVVRLIQANVSQDVLMAYITNSVQPFYMGASEIVFLHDLGAPPAIVTSLINIDATPEMQARKQAAIAVKPLPPGVALNEPAPNIYPARAAAPTAPIPPEPTPVNPPPNAGATVLSPPPPGTTVTYDYPQPTTEVNYSYFYNSLAPYGTWSDVPGYGSCWRPTCATWNSSWRPYSDGGRWLWCDQGWYWYSDYSWGWAPFHYGRWCQPAGYGWVWQPDTCWGPSWVSWRYSPNYCGWAPLPPCASYVSGLGFYFNSGSVGIGFEFGLTAADYCYVPTARFCDPHPHNYCLPSHQNFAVHKETSVINNYVVGNNNTIINNGVGFDRVAKVTRGDVKHVALKDTTSLKNLGTRHDRLESDGSTLTVYRPPASMLSRKGVVPSQGQPVASISRPASYMKPGAMVHGSSPSGSAPSAASASPAGGSRSYLSPGVVDPRTTPSPVTLYTRPSPAANGSVVVTGGSPPPIPTVKSENPRLAPTASSAPDNPRIESLRGSQPAPGTSPTASVPLKSPSTPATPSAGSAATPGKSGYARVEPGSGYVQPVAPHASVARSSGPGYSQPIAVSPSHNPRFATPSAGYIAPSRVETHHSQVSAPSGGRPGVVIGSSGAIGSSGVSGGSRGKASDSSGDFKKGR